MFLYVKMLLTSGPFEHSLTPNVINLFFFWYTSLIFYFNKYCQEYYVAYEIQAETMSCLVPHYYLLYDGAILEECLHI